VSVQTTTVVRNDPGQVFFLVAAMYASLLAWDSERRGSAIAAGVLGGAATGIKYTSVFILLPALLAVLLRGSLQRRLSRGALVVLAFGLTVAITNHFLWYDFPNFVRQLQDQVGITGPGHWGAVENPADFHRVILDRFGPGWPLLLLAAGFGVWGLVAGGGRSWVYWSFPLIYSWFTTQRPSQFPRWVYPLVPFVAVAGGAGLILAAGGLRRWQRWPTSRPELVRRLAVALLIVVALGPPLWSGLVLASRRFTTPTHELAEAWLREHASGTVLLERGWLDLDDSGLKINRVPNLATALQGGFYALCANDWVVVPETHFRNPALAQLKFEHRVVADQHRLGGNGGFDFAIYRTPTLARFPGGDIRLDDPDASRILGPGWRSDGSGAPGLPLPRAGASLFLPPLSQARTRLEIDFIGGGGESGLPPVAVNLGDAPVALTSTPSSDGTRQVTGVIAVADPTRVTELRLSPAPGARNVRVVRVRFETAL
jgi:Dolichyl-phosphate-mannose-protein mannosyltransferase